METQFTKNTADDYRENTVLNSTSTSSPVSWGAIFAGAVSAAALSLILLLLGTGLGLSTVSPWSDKGINGTTFTATTIAWVTFTSLLASAVGGYLAGRLRTRWLNTHTDEIYFRDTAHGFLAWGVATLATATLLTSVISGIVSTGAKAGGTILSGAATASVAAAATGAAATADTQAPKTNTDSQPLPYFLDVLFRKNSTTPANALSTTPLATDASAAPKDTNADKTPNTNAPQPGTTASKAEVARIYVNGVTAGALPVEDIKYAASVVSHATGLSQSDAENRVAETFKSLQTKLRDAEIAARTAADEARKASVYGSLWLFIALLSGAFIASWTAIYGGRQRDL
jgi:hypothetical protein